MQGTERKGPFEGAEWEALVSDGTVTGETWVWQAGMANWQRYAEVGGAAPAAAPAGMGFQASCAH